MLGLIGTVTHDRIVTARGKTLSGLGGILYQAAVSSGLGCPCTLFTHLGSAYAAEARQLMSGWPNLDLSGVIPAAAPGNFVNLFYKARGEREEILESAVPPLKAEQIIPGLKGLGFLLVAFNSGFDITLADWKKIRHKAPCPIWLDLHSLCLEKKIGTYRKYRDLREWPDWAQGVTHLQANLQELACMAGHPALLPSEKEVRQIAGQARELGVSSLWVTLGSRGIRLFAGKKRSKILPLHRAAVRDTTGCGDVFAAAAAVRILAGDSLEKAARFGVLLAGQAASRVGPQAVFRLAAGQGRTAKSQ